MKVKFSGIGIVDGRGKINGSVLSKNRAGAYARTKVTPSNPRTSFQTAVRSFFGSLAAAWRTLTDENRADWNNAVASWTSTDIFGDVKTLSGNALYQAVNQVRNIFGNAPLSSPLAKAALPAVTAGAIVADVSSTTLTIAVDSDINGSVIVYATPPLSAGISNPGTNYRQISQEAVSTGSNTLDLYSAWNTRFGTLVAGQKVFIKLVPASATAGNVGVAVSGSQIIVA